MKKSWAPLVACVCVWSGVGCGGAAGVGGPQQEPDAAAVADAAAADVGDAGEAGEWAWQRAEVAWSPCGEVTFQGLSAPAECAEVEVPFDWEDPGGETIGLFVKRIPGSRAPAGPGRAVWLIPGGPGFGANIMEAPALLYRQLDDGVDLYLPDHRGTARSARLSCPDQESASSVGGVAVAGEAEWRACLEHVRARWGGDEGLANFSSAAAARDLRHLLERTRVEGGFVGLYGVSYGSYLVMRYLQRWSDGFDAVALDSLCPPGECAPGSMQDVHFDEQARALFMQCAQDARCAELAGPDPWATLEQFHADLEARECFGAQTAEEATAQRQTLRALLAALLTQRQLRPALPAIAARGVRCTPDDVAAIERAVSVVFGGGAQGLGPGEGDEGLGPEEGDEGLDPAVRLGQAAVLTAHVNVSELVESPAPTLEQVQARYDATLVAQGTGPGIVGLLGLWPRYEVDVSGGLPEIDAPLLMMHAALDPYTPASLAESSLAKYTGAHQTGVIVEGAGHGVTVASPVPGEAGDCGMQMLVAFMRAPTEPVDTSCAGRVPGPNWEDAGLAAALFGTQSLY